MVCGDGHQIYIILVVACDDEGNGGAVPINRPRQTFILSDLAVIRGLALLHGLEVVFPFFREAYALYSIQPFSQFARNDECLLNVQGTDNDPGRGRVNSCRSFHLFMRNTLDTSTNINSNISTGRCKR